MPARAVVFKSLFVSISSHSATRTAPVGGLTGIGGTPASDLMGTYEWSTDLASWHASGTSAGGTSVTFGAPVVITPGTPDLVEVPATVTGTPASKVFARFKAVQNRTLCVEIHPMIRNEGSMVFPARSEIGDWDLYLLEHHPASE